MQVIVYNPIRGRVLIYDSRELIICHQTPNDRTCQHSKKAIALHYQASTNMSVLIACGFLQSCLWTLSRTLYLN